MTMTDASPGPATARLQQIIGGPAPRNLAPPERSGQAKDDGLYLYWKRSPHHRDEPGYVKTGPAWALYFKKLAGQKWEPLTDYHEFADKWASGEEMVFDPFRHILVSGGAKEFPLQQIRELRWHRYPPRYVQADGSVTTIVFPQLAGRIDPDGNMIDDRGRVLVDHRCPDCPADSPESWFISEVGLRKHQKVQHSEIAGSRQQARDFADAIAGQNAPVQEAIGLMSQLLAHLTDGQRAAVVAQLGQVAPVVATLEDPAVAMGPPRAAEVRVERPPAKAPTARRGAQKKAARRRSAGDPPEEGR
jgi:hypothetical protein